MSKNRKPLIILIGLFIFLDLFIVAWSIIRLKYYPYEYGTYDSKTVSEALLTSFCRFLKDMPIPVLVCQFTLLSLWAGFDKRYAPWRWLISQGFLFASCKFLEKSLSRNATELFISLSLAGILIIAVLWFLSLWELKKSYVYSLNPKENISGIGRFQFPLMLLLEWMTALAVFFGSWSSIIKYELLYFSRDYPYFKPRLFFGEPLMVFSTLWFIMGNPNKKMSRLQFFVFLLFAFGFLYENKNHDPDIIGIYIIQFCIYLFSLSMLYRSGTRLEWRKIAKQS
jgi:hypothetical protein